MPRIFVCREIIQMEVVCLQTQSITQKVRRLDWWVDKQVEKYTGLQGSNLEIGGIENLRNIRQPSIQHDISFYLDIFLCLIG